MLHSSVSRGVYKLLDTSAGAGPCSAGTPWISAQITETLGEWRPLGAGCPKQGRPPRRSMLNLCDEKISFQVFFHEGQTPS